MSSIFNQTDNDAIIARINNITPTSKAAWGKMNATQMCKHTNESLIAAFGEKTVEVKFIFRLFGRLLKDKVFNSEFKKNSPTAKEFIFTDEYDFETVKIELIKNYSRFNAGHQSIKITKHPFWGNMSYDDWNKLMWNHVDHHLRQFNV